MMPHVRNPVMLPVDRLESLWPSALKSSTCRLGAVLHAASVNGRLRPTLSELESLAGTHFQLQALFGPQHGFAASTQDNMIEWQSFEHPRLKIPVHSLYGEYRKPTAAMLEELDALFLDLVDVGSRFYTFIWTMYLCMEACEERGLPMMVCDRPNPINGVDHEGEPQDPDYLSFVGLHPIPIRHGKTIGELASQFKKEAFPKLDLVVLPMEGWDRDQWYDQTGLPWVMPSPNMPTLDTATVYPGMCLLEGTNLSEGRGTTRPFEILGAPWIDSDMLVEALGEQDLAGVHFRSLSFEPTFQKHAGEVCHGVQIHVTDRNVFEPLRTGITMISTIRALWPRVFAWKEPPYEYEHEKLPIEILLGRRLADSCFG